MPTLDEQIEAMKQESEATLELWVKGFAEHREVAMFRSVVESLELLKSSGEVLQVNRKKCPACGKMFPPKNNLQEHCHPNCRVRLHRAKNRLKDFNAKVNDILKAKDPEAKFTIEQVISDGKQCPFMVRYNGKDYASSNTRNLLTQLKRI